MTGQNHTRWRALTLFQPWAACIVWGPKRVENRSWGPFGYGPTFLGTGKQRRWFLVHAGLKPDTIARPPAWPPHADVRGALIGLARISHLVHHVDELPLDQRPWFRGPIGWVLDRVVPLLAPVPAKGAQKFWRVSPSIVDRLLPMVPPDFEADSP